VQLDLSLLLARYWLGFGCCLARCTGSCALFVLRVVIIRGISAIPQADVCRGNGHGGSVKLVSYSNKRRSADCERHKPLSITEISTATRRTLRRLPRSSHTFVMFKSEEAPRLSLTGVGLSVVHGLFASNVRLDPSWWHARKAGGGDGTAERCMLQTMIVPESEFTV